MPRSTRARLVNWLWALLLAASPASGVASAPGCLAQGAQANVSLAGWQLAVQLQEDLPGGSNGTLPCRAVHGGYEGLVSLRCDAGGALAADVGACFRARCPSPRHFLRRSASFEIFAQEAAGAPESATCRWTPFVLVEGGRLLAAPCSAESALELDPAADGGLRFLSGGFSGALKYKSVVAIPGQAVAYGLPFYASSVLRMDAVSGAASTVGVSFLPGGSKWLGGAYAAGKVIGVPFLYEHVLRIDPSSNSVFTLGPDLTSLALAGVGKWWEAVAVGDRVVGIPCGATALLLVDAARETVATFGGPFGYGPDKWSGAVAVPGTDIVYAMPHDADQVLKVDVLRAEAWVIGPDFGTAPGKWRCATLAGDGRIYAAPGSASQVLVVDPRLDSVRAIGQAFAGQNKWAHSVLMPSGHVLGIPGDHTQLLLVDPGSESAMLAGANATALLGGTLGKWSGATLGLDGRAYAPPASASTVLSVSEGACVAVPRSVDDVCTMGLACNITLSGPGFVGGAGDTLRVAAGHCTDSSPQLAHFSGWTNPQVASQLAQNVTRFPLGVATAGSPLLVGAYRLCWSESFALPMHDMGWLTVQGPRPANATCTLGQPCELQIPEGRGLLPSDEVAVLSTLHASNGSEGLAWAAIEGLANPANATLAGAHAFGTPLAGAVGTYALFWGRGGQSEWRVELGTLFLHGPAPISNITCTLGVLCSLVLRGAGLLPGDRIALRRAPESCRDGLGNRSLGSGVRGWCDEASGWCSPSQAASDGGETRYALGAALAFAAGVNGTPPAFELCWESATGPPGAAARFAVHLGLVELRGPVVAGEGSGPLAVCKLGLPCNVTFLGHGLRAADRLALASGGPCPAAGSTWASAGAGDLANVGLAANPAVAANLTSGPFGEDSLPFDLGEPQTGAPGRYRLCWQTSGALGDQAGMVEVGQLDLEENNCTAPAAVLASEPSCAEGGAVPHGGVCTPRCSPQSDLEDATPLRCSAGELSPPGFRCLRRCLVPPMVARGGEQAHCTERVSGATCTVRCPAGHVKSGDLVCRDGHYEHWSNPALSDDFLWAVPRCYLPCQSAALSVANGGAPCAGAAEVPHGGACRATCSSGFSAFDASGASPLAYLQCRDGAFQPGSYTCRRSCQAPAIANAIELWRCEGFSHGQVCTLQCAPFHRKTGDLRCSDGVFSEAACLRPCDVRAFWPRGLPNGPVEPCEGLGPEGLLAHGSECRPACSPGFSNIVEAERPQCRDGSLMLPNGTSAATVCCHAGCPSSPPRSAYPHAPTLGETCYGLQHSQECPLVCEDGAEADGSVRCVDGSYVGGACLMSCLLPVVPNSKGIDHCHGTKHNATCPFDCQQDHVKVGELRCLFGSWVRLDLCKAPCAAADAYEVSGHAAAAKCAEGELVMHGGNCTYQCSFGYSSTVARASCVDGSFEPPSFFCQLRLQDACGPPELPGVPENALRDCRGMRHGDVCEFAACAPGYAKSLPLRCAFGNWTRDACIDMRPRCREQPVVANGVVPASCAGSLAGVWCPATCHAGFQPGLGVGFTCADSGEWVGLANCVPTACGLPVAPTHGQMSCNGEAAADRCQVHCAKGYGGDGELVCSRGAAGAGAWEWRAEPAPPSTGLCEPLPCDDVPFVPGVRNESCAGLAHGGACASFACDDGLAPDGAFRCLAGGFEDVPVCLPAPHGFASVLAVAFRLGARVVGYWGSFDAAVNWGQLGARLVELALNRSLAERPLGQVQLLAWSSRDPLSNNQTSNASAASGPRRLYGEVFVDYLTAVAPPLDVAGPAGAGDLAAGVSALTPLGLSMLIAGEQGPTYQQREAYFQFTAVGAPSYRYLPVPAPAPLPTLPPPTTTTTPPPPNTTTTAALAELVVDDSFGRVLRDHWIFIVLVLLVVFGTCCGLYALRRRNHHLMVKLRSMPRKIRMKRMSLVRNAPRPESELDPSQLQAMAALAAAVRKETQVSSDIKENRQENEEYVRQERRRNSVVGVDALPVSAYDRKRRDSLASLVSMYQTENIDGGDAQQDFDEATKNILRASRQVVQKQKRRMQEIEKKKRERMQQNGGSLWAAHRVEDLPYLMKTQADYEPANDLPDDWLERGRKERAEAEKRAARQQKEQKEQQQQQQQPAATRFTIGAFADGSGSPPPQDGSARASRDQGASPSHGRELSRIGESEEDAASDGGKSPSLGHSPRSNASHEASERSARSAWSQKIGREVSATTTDKSGSISGKKEERGVRARRGSLAEEATVVKELSQRRIQGKLPERAKKINRHTLQNAGRSTCRMSQAEPTRRNFQHRVRASDFDDEEEPQSPQEFGVAVAEQLAGAAGARVTR